MILDEEVDGEREQKKTLQSQIGVFILSNGKTIMNNFNRVRGAFKTNSVYYQDAGSFYIETKHRDKLN